MVLLGQFFFKKGTNGKFKSVLVVAVIVTMMTDLQS